MTMFLGKSVQVIGPQYAMNCFWILNLCFTFSAAWIPTQDPRPIL